MSLPWVIKYQPTKISEFVGNGEAIGKLREWLGSWDRKTPAKRGAFLYGPPGVGKTSSIYLFGKELHYDVIEMNASDYRTKKDVERLVGMVMSQSTLYGFSKRIVVLDEVEGISNREDRQGISTIIKMVRTATSPIVLIADDAWNPKFRDLRRYCVLIEFKRLSTRSITAYLRKICREEKIEAEDPALQFIADRAGGDLRSALIDLQTLSKERNFLAYKDVGWLDTRNRAEKIFDVLRTIFTAADCITARRALEVANVDYEMLFEWIYENVPYQFTEKEDLLNAIEALAKADLYFQKIRATQNWKLLPYALDMMSIAVAMSRKKTRPKWSPFKFPQRISMLSRTRQSRLKMLKIGAKIGDKCHTSARLAIVEYLPYLKMILTAEGSIVREIAKKFDFDEDEVSYLTGK